MQFQMFSERELAVMAEANQIAKRALCAHSEAFTSPGVVNTFLQTHLRPKCREIFCALWLDNQHRMILLDEVFQGTLDSCTVNPRDIVVNGLKVNAAAVIFAHNHPSGMAEPSRQDRVITERLVSALSLVDIRVLDHIVVGEQCVSFAERGWL
ncbi:RadC family protein [Aeromonas caviae]|uniref:RadC family protein n=1 Tax=Aeromonas caviae TaxID=648 RepID=UPI0029D99E96|nr:DNA repair protein RadC [Aeromonas caviae]MDX7789000.1 DNA repair protein RadC [Aeromonas caviae]